MELIRRLQAGNMSEAEFKALLSEMEAKGLRGTVMAVPEGPESEEGQAAREYIAYHEKVPHAWRLSEIEGFKATLLNPESSLEQKKQAMVILAHIGRPDVLQTLEEYARQPDEELRIWINMALQECESFLKSDILDEPVMSVGRVSKIGRNEPCPCGAKKEDGSPVKYKHCHGRDATQS